MKKEARDLFSDVFSSLMADNLRNSVAIVEIESILLESLELSPQKKKRLQESLDITLSRIEKNIAVLEKLKNEKK